MEIASDAMFIKLDSNGLLKLNEYAKLIYDNEVGVLKWHNVYVKDAGVRWKIRRNSVVVNAIMQQCVQIWSSVRGSSPFLLTQKS